METGQHTHGNKSVTVFHLIASCSFNDINIYV